MSNKENLSEFDQKVANLSKKTPDSVSEIKSDSTKKVNTSISEKLLLPMSIVFLAITLSSSLILSSFIVSKAVKENPNLLTSKTSTSSTSTNTTPAPTAAVNVSQDQIKAIFSSKKYMTFGDENRKVLFVEALDPSCPYCHVAGGLDSEVNKQMGQQFILVKDGGNYVAPIEEMRKLVNDGKASMAVIYTTGHGNGKLSMQALYCAYDQNKFWEVHDLLMNNAGYNLQNNDVKNDVANSGKLADYLAPAIDKSYMQSCLESKKYETRVTSDEQFATRTLGVQGTPGLFVNNISYNGAYSWSDMKATVDNALKQ